MNGTRELSLYQSVSRSYHVSDTYTNHDTTETRSAYVQLAGNLLMHVGRPRETPRLEVYEVYEVYHVISVHIIHTNTKRATLLDPVGPRRR